MALDVLLLLADEAPQLVKLKALGAHADHDAVVQFHAASPTRSARLATAPRLAPVRREAGTDADAFTESGNDFNLLFAAESSVEE